MAKLRMVRLNEVAQYLECDPKKLCIALKHLSAVPSGIWYSKDGAVIINPGVRDVAPTPESAAKASLAALSPEAAAVRQEDPKMQSVWDKMAYNACDRLNRAGGKGNYSLKEVLAEWDGSKTPEARAWHQVFFLPAFTRYRAMTAAADEKWRN